MLSAFLFGSFAARLSGQSGAAPAGIDVMVVGNPDPMAVYGGRLWSQGVVAAGPASSWPSSPGSEPGPYPAANP